MSDVVLNIDLEKFRYSLVGDGYLKEEVIAMSDDKLISILKQRVQDHIHKEYEKSRRFGFVDIDEKRTPDPVPPLKINWKDKQPQPVRGFRAHMCLMSDYILPEEKEERNEEDT